MNLRERTRAAVKNQITEVASALFEDRGYKETTIDDIAAAIGMSQRSVFRYFPTKEALVIGKFDRVAERMLTELAARPEGEDLWQSLRRMFDVIAAYADGKEGKGDREPIQQIVFETPDLLLAYLQRLQHLQEQVLEVIIDRARRLGQPYTNDDPAPRALIAAAFGCLVAAQHAWQARRGVEHLGEMIDQAMLAVRRLGA